MSECPYPDACTDEYPCAVCESRRRVRRLLDEDNRRAAARARPHLAETIDVPLLGPAD